MTTVHLFGFMTAAYWLLQNFDPTDYKCDENKFELIPFVILIEIFIFYAYLVACAIFIAFSNCCKYKNLEESLYG